MDFKKLTTQIESLETPDMKKAAEEVLHRLEPSPWLNIDAMLKTQEAIEKLMNAAHQHADDIFVENPYENIREFLITLHASLSKAAGIVSLQETVYTYLEEINETDEVLRTYCALIGISTEEMFLLLGPTGGTLPRTNEELTSWLQEKLCSVRKRIQHASKGNGKLEELYEKCEASLKILQEKRRNNPR